MTGSLTEEKIGVVAIQPATLPWPNRLQTCLYRASTICLALTLLLLPFPVRLPLVDGFERNSLTALDAYPADFTALGAIAYALLGWLINLRFTHPKGTRDLRFTIFNSKFKIHPPGNPTGRNSKFLVIFFLLWAALSLLWSSEPIFGWLMLARLGGGVGIVLVAARQSAANRKMLAALLVTGGTIQGAIALWQFVHQEAVSLIFWPTIYAPEISGSSVVQAGPGIDFVLRAYGTLSHPNVLGGYLTFAILAAIYLRLTHPEGTRDLRLKSETTNSKLGTQNHKLETRNFFSNRQSSIVNRQSSILKGLLIFSTFVMLGGLVVSFSRSAWVGLACGLVFLSYQLFLNFARKTSHHSNAWKLNSLKFKIQNSLRRGGLRPKFKILLLLILLLVAVLATPLTNRLFRLDLPLERNSLDERVNYFNSAFELIGQHPWLGVGLSNYTVYAATRPDSGRAARFPVHNVPLLLWGELGLPGVLLWLLILLMALWRPGPELIWPAALVAFAAIAQFDHYLWTQPQAQMLCWLTIGLCFAAKRHPAVKYLNSSFRGDSEMARI